MTKTQTFDVAVLGGGPGGYVAAIRAAQLGLKTAVIEREHLGGICLNWGCIPTKALLRTAEVYHNMLGAEAFGLSADGVGFDIAKVVARSRKVSARLNAGVGHLMKKNKVTVIMGEGKINGPGKLNVTPNDSGEAHTVAAKHIIIATGARPRALPGMAPDGEKIWTYFEAMVPKSMPKSLLIIGSGAIGIEFASFYHTMGCDVTVVEVLGRIMPAEDAEISAHVQKRMVKSGMKIITGAKVAKLDTSGAGVTATIETADGKTEKIKAERAISAAGVVGNIENIGLETTKVKTEKGCIAADGWGRTAAPGVYAIGDVAGPPMLAHKAEHEGVICVEKIAGQNPHPLDKSRIPGCTYCHPQAASVGLTEAAAKAAGHEVRVGRFPFAGNGKAIALGEPEGIVKTVFDAKTGQLLGAHMAGAEVTELIQGFVIAIGLETTEEDLMHTCFPHPTLSEMMHESVLDAYGRVIHM
ncbi:MAG: dihydrolipoyl dehydrogenase [Rhodospirillales bacterium]